MQAARRLTRGDVGGRTDPDALAAFGLPASCQQVDDPIDVWPENATTVRVFVAMGTQWATAGMSGQPIGLRYEALPVVMRYCGVPPKDRADVFIGVRCMEQAALEEMRN